jgi:hypothetical protein
MYQDGKVGEVEDQQLDALIHSKKIKKFFRSGKWATIGVDPIREVREYFVEAPKTRGPLKNTQKKK